MISKEDGKNILTYLNDEREEVKSAVALSFHFEMVQKI